MRTSIDRKGLLGRLDGAPADALESETLECKGWDQDPRRWKVQVRETREAVVCLANRRGGTILLGIADGARTRKEAIVGVGDLDAEALRREIYRGTAPPLLVEIEEWVEPEGRLLAVHVPRGVPPHTTTEGIGKIRVGKECRPLTGADLTRLVLESRSVDLTWEVVAKARPADLDPVQVKALRTLLAREGGKPALAALTSKEMLANLGLVRDDGVSLAAILLLGRGAAIARFAPQHEVTVIRYDSPTHFDKRYDLKEPLLAVLDRMQRILEDHMRLTSVQERGFGELLFPDISWLAAREAILNALAHRDWFQHQSVFVEMRPGRLEVASPGGFLGGVTPDNILRHPPVRRNPLLAETFQAIGFVNRAGLGVDRIYEDLLRSGKGIPSYEADEAGVRLKLPTRTHEAFARFVAEEERARRRLDLDDLVVLWTVTARGEANRKSAARNLQLSEDDASDKLAALRGRGLLVARGRGRGTSYRLARHLSDLIRGRAATDLDIDLDEEAARLRVQSVLAERGSLSNADIRGMTGLARQAAVRLMNRLRDEDLARVAGRGRSARWLPGPTLVGKSKRGRERGGRRSPRE
ncbi:MAG: putative DNA binding domain-containing protein [Planctomycetes bacterium]|nr:putative DNA binding domain-containing protein [Planctomycetota bacterium]